MRTASDRATVLHIIDTGGPGGAETVFSQIASRIRGDAMESVAVVPREGWLSGQLRSLGIEPIVLAARGSLNVRYLSALLGIARRHEAKLIQTHLLGSAVYGALVGLLRKTPVIAVFHGPTDLRAPGTLAFVKRKLITHGCAAIVAVSSSTRATLLDFGVRPERITLIQNGVDTDLYSPGDADDLRLELGLQPQDALVAAVGNIRAPKAYDVLIRAAAIVLRSAPRALFAVIGEGSANALAPLQELSASLGLGERLKFLGFRKSTANLFRNFDVFVSSSRSEGLSLSFLEAMATGRAVVATRSGGPQEVLEHGRSGLLVPIEDPAALAAALLQVLENPGLRDTLGAAARQRAVEQFSLASTVKNYEELYRRVLRI
jgi:glycosyltransferase involved in cell wall biosynthesis